MPGEKNEKPSLPKLVQQERVQLLPYLTKYFKSAGLLVFVWGVGYFRFSASWVMLGLFFYMLNEEVRKIKKGKHDFAIEASINEKKAILARTDELPSWVYFPDVERAEWLNKMIKQMWPYIGAYVKRLLIDNVELSIQNSLPSSLQPFRFEKIDLGDVPPRIGGIKVYIDNLKRDEMVLDIELVYASDSQIKVTVKGMKAGIKDLSIHGNMRIVMKPLVSVMPIIGAVNVFFLNSPQVDFDLTNTANFLDVPLLSNTLRRIVQDQIAAYLVLPNKIPYQLIQDLDVSRLKYPVPAGVIRLHVVAGRELKKADIGMLGKGKSDPYCNIYVGAQEFTTKVIQNSVSPAWNQYFEAVIDHKHGQFVEFEVKDKDPGEDDDLGNASVDIETVAKTGEIDSWLPLENITTGMLHIRASWLYLSRNPKDLAKAEESSKKIKSTVQSEEHLSSALLMLTCDSAKSLPRKKKSMSEPSPYCKIRIGNQERDTKSSSKTTDPKWDQNFQFLIADPEHQDINFEIRDSGKVDRRLGVLTYKLNLLMQAPDMTVDRSFSLKESTAVAQLTFRACLRVLTSEKPATWALDSDDINIPATADEGTSVDSTAYEDPELPAARPMEPAPPLPVPSGTVSAAGDADDGLRQRKPDVKDKGAESDDDSIPDEPSCGAKLSEETEWGKIQLTIRYSQQRSKLTCVVHKCEGLMPCDDNNLADPYVRVYLTPISSSTKRKTQVVKDDLNPIFDETFEWSTSLAEAQSRSLSISIKNQNSLFSKNRVMMGAAEIDLRKMDLTSAHTEWFHLQDPDIAD